MCWNETVSLNTFLFSLFGISLAYFNNVIITFKYLYLISFISIQLLEYFTWKHLNNIKINRLLSQIGLFIIFIQPILFILSIPNVKYSVKTPVLALYILFFLFCVIYFPIDFSMKKAPNGHLAWNWLKFPSVIIFIWLFFLLVLLLYVKNYILFIMNLIIFLAIYYTYYKTNTWGSLWCWIANLATIFYIAKVFFKFWKNKT
uniref:Uncharacterized protein n=1 Tax=viral metagenome TaxID=1070528 RepID=A0A6C0H3L0_9ZZZZ